MPADVLGSILDFAYTGRVELNIENIQPLLRAADFLQLDLLSNECARYLEYKMAHSNVLGIRRLAALHNSQRAVRATDRYIQSHFVAVSESEDFLLLDVDALCDILARDELHVDSEEQVFEAAIRWLQFDEQRSPLAAR